MNKVTKDAALVTPLICQRSIQDQLITPPQKIQEGKLRWPYMVQQTCFWQKSGVRSDDIGILVVDCCIYNAVPSLSSIIVNKYKLRDKRYYHLQSCWDGTQHRTSS